MPSQWTFPAVVLALEVAVFSLAFAHARSGRFAVQLRWLTRAIAIAALLVSVGAIYSAAWEITTFDYPWTRPGRPFGTYAEPSALGVATIAVEGVAFALAAMLAFVRPRLAMGILLAIAVTTGIDALRWLSDPSAPPGNAFVALVVGPALPALTLAALLWSLRAPLLGPLPGTRLGPPEA